jgi:hypothetical protein
MSPCPPFPCGNRSPTQQARVNGVHANWNKMASWWVAWWDMVGHGNEHTSHVNAKIVKCVFILVNHIRLNMNIIEGTCMIM